MAQCPHCQNEISGNPVYCPHCEHILTKDIYARSFTTGGIWGTLVLFGIVFFLIFKVSTSGDSFYNKGYQDGSEEVKNGPLFFLSKKYQAGHADGLSVAWYFDKGCEDKVDQLRPRYPDEKKYMEGYNFC